MFLARFDEQDEDDQVLEENDLYNNSKIYKTLVKSDIDDLEFKSPLEQQIQKRKLKGDGWRFDKTTSMKIFSCRTTELDSSINKNFPKRSSIILYFENNDKYCFPWSILANLRPSKDNDPKRVSDYRQ